MDSNGKIPRGANKAARPEPATDATQPQQPAAARAALETRALSADDATAAQKVVDDGQPDVASVDESHGAEEAEDNHDDDEQVERFYALLANIRAMRGLPLHNMASSSSFCAAGGGGDTDAAGDYARTKKRLRRSAEPPWRPVFRMEDFEEPPPPPTPASCKLMKRTRVVAGHDDHGHGESSGGSPRPPVAVVASSSSTMMPHAAVRFQQSDDSSRD